MSDLVGGNYPQHSAMASFFGNAANETQSNIPVRGNHEYGIGQWVDGAVAGTGVACAVAVPMDPGTVIKRVTLFVGGTAASTPTHTSVAIYSGIATPALLGTQGTDVTTTAVAASGLFQQALGAPYLVKPADCPNGYIYAAFTQTATAAITAWGFTTPTAVGIQYLTGSTTPAGVMPMFAATSGSALGGTFAATLTLVAKAVAPLMVLS